MKVLLVKTSSLGDLIHTMPAITDLAHYCPDLELHWLVEETFSDIPRWHPKVKKVHCCAIRRWRKSWFARSTRLAMAQLKAELSAEQFDLVIDAQGLFKSALISRYAQAPIHGYNRKSIREPLASFFYQKRYMVDYQLPAISRTRQLFAQILGYQCKENPQFGMHINKPAYLPVSLPQQFVVFLHGTQWSSKIWPLTYWQTLARLLTEHNIAVLTPYGNETEKTQAHLIARDNTAKVLPPLTLNQLGYVLQQATLVVGSDTGLNHIAAALDTNAIGLFGPTNSSLTGLQGAHVVNLQSTLSCSPCMNKQCPIINENIIPCYESIATERVFKLILQHFVEKNQ